MDSIVFCVVKRSNIAFARCEQLKKEGLCKGCEGTDAQDSDPRNQIEYNMQISLSSHTDEERINKLESTEKEIAKARQQALNTLEERKGEAE